MAEAGFALPPGVTDEAVQRYIDAGFPPDQAVIHAGSEVKRNQLAKQGLNPDGSPMRPEYNSLIDPATGLLKKEYTMQVGTLDPSKLEGYQALKGEALRTGPSKWAQLQAQLQNTQRSADMDRAAGQAMSGAATARSGLAMRGGLSSGARERIALGASRNLIDARQGVGRQATVNALNLASTDEQNRLGTLKGFNESEMGLSKYNTDLGNKEKEFNITRALDERARAEADKLEKYKAELSKWGAGQQATATANSGGGGK